MKIYTGTGDDGTTGLRGGRRVSKGSARILAYGAVDEANSVLGAVLSCGPDPDITSLLTRIQSDLFVAGADLSSPDLSALGNRTSPAMVGDMEAAIDRYEEDLPPLSNFILPGGGQDAALIHLARTVVRRAEAMAVTLAESEAVNRSCITYLNRLSDLLFVLARTVNRRSGIQDVIWRPQGTGPTTSDAEP